MAPIYECSLKIKDFPAIPMPEELVDELLFLMNVRDYEYKIKRWMIRAKIEIVNYDYFEHEIDPSKEIVLEMFWYAVQKIIEETEQNKLHLYRRFVINAAREKNHDHAEWRNNFKLLSELSAAHLDVLHLGSGVLDYCAHKKIPIPNTLNETWRTLYHIVQDTIPKLRDSSEKIIPVWNDLLRYGLRKEKANLSMRTTEKRLARFSMLSGKGKNFLTVIIRN